MDHPHVPTAGLTLFMTYYDWEAIPCIGFLYNHTWKCFPYYSAGFYVRRLLSLALRTKELLHWSVLPWPRRDTLRVCAYFPIGVLLIL